MRMKLKFSHFLQDRNFISIELKKKRNGKTIFSDRAPEDVPERLDLPPRYKESFSAEELAQIESLHKEALNAYRRQNLDKAIGLWDEVLALDPEHENARLYRSQAISLKKKLSNLN